MFLKMNLGIYIDKHDSSIHVDFGDSALCFSDTDTESEIVERIGKEVLEYIKETKKMFNSINDSINK